MTVETVEKTVQEPSACAHVDGAQKRGIVTASAPN